MIGWPRFEVVRGGRGEARFNDPLTSAAVKWSDSSRSIASRDRGTRGRQRPAAVRGTDIAMIIDFRAHALRFEPRLEASTTGAEIIIFPGVRRERQSDPAKPRHKDKARPKRDRLELPD
jgi:hypothetical protein